MNSFYTTFHSEQRGVNAFPWSSCTFHLQTEAEDDKDGNEEKHPPRQTSPFRVTQFQFVQDFGNLLKMVKLDGNDTSGMAELLSGMPNLEELIVGSDDLEEIEDALPLRNDAFPLSPFQLRKLKRMRITIYGVAEINFLEILLTNTGAVLDRIEVIAYNLQTDVDKLNEQIQKLSTLMALVPSIFLTFCGKEFKIYATMMRILMPTNLRVHQLSFLFPEMRPYTAIYGPRSPYSLLFPTIVSFLQSISLHLGKLELFCRRSPSITPISLPFLAELEEISFQEEVHSFGVPPCRSPLLLIPDRCPKLRKVELFACNRPGPGSLIFPSVNELIGRLDPIRATPRHWHSVFPNLTILDLSDSTLVRGHLTTILANMKGLVRLEFKLILEPRENLGAILSGISKPDDLYQKSETEISMYRTAYPKPSILSMTRKVFQCYLFVKCWITLQV